MQTDTPDPAPTRGPNRKERRTMRFGGAGLTADSRVITLRQSRDDATPARTARAKRVRARRQAIRDARRASR